MATTKKGASSKKKAAKKSAPRKAAPKKAAPKKAAPEQASRSLELEDWLGEVRQHAATALAAAVPQGACLVPNPRTGGNDCVRTDQVTCTTRLHGTWIGGPCGPS
jgi:membrane protein involved in colicin uptake